MMFSLEFERHAFAKQAGKSFAIDFQATFAEHLTRFGLGEFLTQLENQVFKGDFGSLRHGSSFDLWRVWCQVPFSGTLYLLRIDSQ